MYKPINNPESLQDLLARKEFYALAQRDNKFRETQDTEDILTGEFLKIHSHQLFVRNFMNPNTEYKRLHLMHGTGCHGAGTLIYRANGSLAAIEDIRIGDKLLGPDMRPRNVIGLARGREQLYEVVPECGMKFTVNGSHILCLGDNGLIHTTVDDYMAVGCNLPLYRVKPRYNTYKWLDMYRAGYRARKITREYRCSEPTAQSEYLAGYLDSRAKITRDGLTISAKHVNAEFHALLASNGLALIEDCGLIVGDLSAIPTRTTIYSPALNLRAGLRFHIRQTKVAAYYGVVLDEDQLYVLCDGTVSHNTGKCLGADTPVLLFGGGEKYAQNIRVGDQLIGDDGEARHVASTCSGIDEMVRITTNIGTSFTCNLAHMLTVIDDDAVYDISVKNYEKLTVARRGTIALMTTPINYEYRPCGCLYTIGLRGNALNIIPDICVYNAYHARLEFLAGFVDYNGSYDSVIGAYRIRVKAHLIERMMFIILSIGLMAWRLPDGIIFAGSQTRMLPLRIGQVQPTAAQSRQLYFSIEHLGRGTYYGFTLTGNNGRFVLGNTIITHNTNAAAGIAANFINQYRQLYAVEAPAQMMRKERVVLDAKTPSVYILGFAGAKKSFFHELLTYPEFGMISYEERDELTRLRLRASAGNPNDTAAYKEYYNELKRRLSDKSKGGFYRFYGYDEFVNRLFIISGTASMTDIEAYVSKNSYTGKNTKDLVDEFVKTTDIIVDTKMLARMRDSLIIADEIHNTYNAAYKNNRGIAIQYILDSGLNVRFLSLSATPINNSPNEVVDFINYLSSRVITHGELFAGPRELKPEALALIGRESFGKISFLQDSNLKYFPRVYYEGEPLILRSDVADIPAGSRIPYLNFIACDMSEFHENTYKAYSASDASDETAREDLDGDEIEDITEPRALSMDGYALFDIAFPNPDSANVGLYKGAALRNKYMNAPAEWLAQEGVAVKRGINNMPIYSGTFLRADNIAKYSSKYHRMISNILALMKRANGEVSRGAKMLIYHDRVRTSGVLLIQEILIANGIIDETSDPASSTICALCACEMNQHGDTHAFYPARFIMAHGEISKATLDASLAKYDAPDNKNGTKYAILIGSKLIRESYNFKAIQHLMIMTAPINISTLLQVFGRCVRKNSHANLGRDSQEVHIWIYISTSQNLLAPEIVRYAAKMSNYRVIQKIEREFNRNAIDAATHADINMSADKRKTYFPSGTGTDPIATIGNLYFDPAVALPEEMSLATFDPFDHGSVELREIILLIKRLFIMRPVWTWDELARTIHAPPFQMETDPKLFTNENIAIAVAGLLAEDSAAKNVIASNKKSRIISALLNYSDNSIYINNVQHRVRKVGNYYIAFPVIMSIKRPLSMKANSAHIEGRDKESRIINEFSSVSDHLYADADSFHASIRERRDLHVQLAQHMRAHIGDTTYQLERARFIKSAGNFFLDYPIDFQSNFIEEAIAESVRGRVIPQYNEVLESLRALDAVITLSEIKRYKEIARLFRVLDLQNNAILGYVGVNSVRLYDYTNPPRWMDVNKTALNRHTYQKENTKLIGLIEAYGHQMKFKIRPPLKHMTDAREVERGIVCETKKKSELLELARALEIEDEIDGNSKVKTICDTIREHLISREIEERRANSNVKYVYFWWNNPPSARAIN